MRDMKKTHRRPLYPVPLRLAALCLAIAAPVALAAQGVAGTVWSTVYSPDQAARGKVVYEAKCVVCHGATLTGGDSAPPLAGAKFLNNWNSTSAGDLFERIQTTMPVTAPGTLSGAQVAAVEAYILQTNHFPAGDKPLPPVAAALAGIKITAQRPAD